MISVALASHNINNQSTTNAEAMSAVILAWLENSTTTDVRLATYGGTAQWIGVEHNRTRVLVRLPFDDGANVVARTRGVRKWAAVAEWLLIAGESGVAYLFAQLCDIGINNIKTSRSDTVAPARPVNHEVSAAALSCNEIWIGALLKIAWRGACRLCCRGLVAC